MFADPVIKMWKEIHRRWSLADTCSRPDAFRDGGGSEYLHRKAFFLLSDEWWFLCVRLLICKWSQLLNLILTTATHLNMMSDAGMWYWLFPAGLPQCGWVLLDNSAVSVTTATWQQYLVVMNDVPNALDLWFHFDVNVNFSNVTQMLFHCDLTMFFCFFFQSLDP